VPLVLDGGPCQVGLESTIIDLTSGRPAILRPGGITAEQVAAILKHAVASGSADAPRVSGSLSSHYAPRARVELVEARELLSRASQLAAAGQHVALLGTEAVETPPGVTFLPLPPDPTALAQALYAALRQVDELGCDVAVASLPATGGLGAAIADRLRKAAGPR
jgi:L-threonylcarbamoyladenylate synthase